MLRACWPPRRRVVVVAMGRGGAERAEVVAEPPTVERLLALSREGRHAASDHLEDAALAGVPTGGARRCGGGLAGAPAPSERPGGRRGRAGARPGARPLRGQRRGAAADRDRPAHPRRLCCAAAGAARRVPQPVSHPGFRPCRRGRGRGHDGAAGDRGGEASPGRARRASPTACRAGSRSARRVLLDGAARGARRDRGPSGGAARGGRGPRVRQPRAAHGAACRAGARRRDVFVTELKAAAVDAVAEEAAARGFRSSLPATTSSRSRATWMPRCSRSPTRSSRRRRSRHDRTTLGIDPSPLGGGEDRLPYSKGLMTRTLMATGTSAVKAYELARAIERDLEGSAQASADLDRGAPRRRRAARGGGATPRRPGCRYLRVRDLEQPIVVLIGGRLGSGKVAGSPPRSLTGSASRGSPRPTSSGRRCARSSPRSSCRRSTTRASKRATPSTGNWPDQQIGGFLEQTRDVLVGVRAALDRALHEGLSMVLEGVHLVLGILDDDPRPHGGQCSTFLAVQDERGARAPLLDPRRGVDGRASVTKYLERWNDIRRIQQFIVDHAREVGGRGRQRRSPSAWPRRGDGGPSSQAPGEVRAGGDVTETAAPPRDHRGGDPCAAVPVRDLRARD